MNHFKPVFLFSLSAVAFFRALTWVLFANHDLPYIYTSLGVGIVFGLWFARTRKSPTDPFRGFRTAITVFTIAFAIFSIYAWKSTDDTVSRAFATGMAFVFLCIRLYLYRSKDEEEV